MFHHLRRVAILTAAIAAIGGAATVPAFASTSTCTPTSGSTNCVVNVTIPVSISITGLTDVTFPPGTAGNIDTMLAAESYTVSANSSYTLSEAASQADFTGPANIPDSAWSADVFLNGSGSPVTSITYSTTPTTVYTDVNGPETDTFKENWHLAIPVNTPAGTYTNQLNYLAVGS